MTKLSILYIIESTILIFVIGYIIFSTIKKKNHAFDDIFSESGIVQFRKSNNNHLIISLIVFFLLLLIFLIQFVFEYPQFQKTYTLNVGSKLSEDTIKIYLHNKNIFNKTIGFEDVDTSKIGDQEINVKIPYQRGYIDERITISVKDLEAPTIETTLKDNMEISYNEDINSYSYTANDNVDGNITEKVIVTSNKEDNNTLVVNYSVIDSHNNITNKSIKLKLVDKVPPTIELNGSKRLSLKVGEEFTDEGVTANDEYDGDLTSKVQVDSTVDTENAGTYRVVYTVSDNSGNTAEVIRPVTVSNPDDYKGVVYLTFDDGPSSNITPAILDILKEKGVKATFFIINWSDGNADLIKREVEEGHTIGLHSYSHVYSEDYKDDDSYMNGIYDLRKKLYDLTGYDSKLLRFPGGSSNTISKDLNPGVMTRLSERVIKEGYRYFDWNVSSGDAGGTRSVDVEFHNVVDNLSYDRANVVLMHDFGNSSVTRDSLANIIDWCLENGYRIEPITEATPMVTHGINN